MYSALADIIKLIPEESLVQLTDDEGLGVVNQGRVDEAISQADAEIDSYIGGRYAVPLSSVPDVVKKMSVDIAIYNLYSRRVETMPEIRTEKYKNAINLLKDISKGLATLGVDPAPTASTFLTDGGAETSTETDERVFSREKMEGF